MKPISKSNLIAHQALWRLLPEEAKRNAYMKQTAALAMRLCDRNNMTEMQAMDWVIGLKKLSMREFKNTAAGIFENGDVLQMWQFKEIVALNLQDDFLTRRRLQQWQAAEEPWLFDERWSYPLHLVDSEAMPKFWGRYA